MPVDLDRGPRTVLVTGGAGFIGSHLVEHLLREGHRVRVLDDLSTGRRSNLEAASAAAGEGAAERLDLIEGDLAELDACRAAAEAVDGVLHQGALPSVPRSIADPLATHRANVTGTLNLLVAARDAGVGRVVLASSSSVYGDSGEGPKVEDQPSRPRSPYAFSKLAGEHYAALFHELYGLETVCLRYFNVFGPRQDPGSPYAAVIPLFLAALREGRPPLIHGDGLQSRDFTYVDNAVQANLRALVAPDAAPGACNVGAGQRTTLLAVLEALQRILGTGVEPTHGDSRPGDVRHSLADLTRSRERLGYEPSVDLDEGLRRLIASAEAG